MDSPPPDSSPRGSAVPPSPAAALDGGPAAGPPGSAGVASARVHVVTVTMRKGDRYDVSCETLPPEAFEAVKSVLDAPWRDARYVVGYLNAVASAHDLRGLVVRYVSLRRPAPPVKPIPVRFEPLPLDETHPSLRSLAETFALGDGAGTAARRPNRWRRLMVKMGIPLLVVLPQLINGIIQIAIQRSRIIVYMWVSIFVIFALSAVLVRWALSDWYLVPGGLVLRRHLVRRLGETMQLYTPADSLLILRMRNGGWAAEVWRGRRPKNQLLTDLEAAALIGAWTSPQEPPDAARISDLS